MLTKCSHPVLGGVALTIVPIVGARAALSTLRGRILDRTRRRVSRIPERNAASRLELTFFSSIKRRGRRRFCLP